jgi:hypothetical protein
MWHGKTHKKKKKGGFMGRDMNGESKKRKKREGLFLE